MRAIIRVILRETTDEEAMAIKKKIATALEKVKDIEIEMTTMGG